MCYSQFFGKKEKDQNPVSCTKKIAYFWFSQGMIIFPGGERHKMEFPDGRGGGVYPGSRFWKIPSGGGRSHTKNPFRGGVWIFSGTTHCIKYCLSSL